MAGPELTLAAQNRNWTMSGRYTGGAEFSVRHPESNRYSQTLAVDLHLPFISQEFRRLDLRMTESVAYVPELPAFSFRSASDPLPPEANQGIQVGRTTTFRNRAGIVLDYAWTPRFNTSLTYSNLITRYHSEALEDYVVHEGGLSGAYQATRKTTWIGSYATSLTRYEKGDPVATHRFHVEDRYTAGPTLSLIIGAGIAIVPGDAIQWTSSAEVGKSGRMGTLSLRYDRGVGTGGGVTTTAALTQNLVGQASWVNSRSTSTSFQLGYGLNEAISGPPVRISTRQIGIGVQKVLLSWLRGELNYSYLNQRTEGSGIETDVRRNQVMMTLTATAPPLRILQ